VINVYHTMCSNMIHQLKKKKKKKKKKVNIFKIDSIWYPLNFPPESQERSLKVELFTKGSVFRNSAVSRCILIRINRITNYTNSFVISVRCRGTLGNESVFFFFFFNLSKSNSRELLMIGIVLVRYFASPTIYETEDLDPCELFRGCSLKCPRSPSIEW